MIKLEAEIDLENGVTKVKPIQNPWQDLGYFLEVVSFLAKMNIGHPKAETPEEMAEYIKQYLLNGMAGYTDVTGKPKAEKC